MSTSDDLLRSWEKTRALLAEAVSHLPVSAPRHTEAIATYEEWLSHNELGLAWEDLEYYAEKNKCPPEFWDALGRAAAIMGRTLRSRAEEN